MDVGTLRTRRLDHRLHICKVNRFFMMTGHLLTYLSLYLSQAVSLPPQLGIQWDLFRHIQLGQDVELEPLVVSCSFIAPLFPAEPVKTGQVRKDKTGPFLRRIAPNPLLLVIGAEPWM